MFAQAFRAVAVLLNIYEMDKDGWHHAAIYGHSKASKLYPLTTAEAELLWGWGFIVVRYHCRGLPMEVNACFLNSYMVYL